MRWLGVQFLGETKLLLGGCDESFEFMILHAERLFKVFHGLTDPSFIVHALCSPNVINKAPGFLDVIHAGGRYVCAALLYRRCADCAADAKSDACG